MTPETAVRLKELEPGWDWNVSLTKLLSRIEKEGFEWQLRPAFICIGREEPNTLEEVCKFFDGNPDEVAGQALAWILDEKNG